MCIVDMLKALKFAPKVTAGYSYGELICAYFDGVLKIEEALECALIFNSELNNNEKVRMEPHYVMF